MEGADRLGALDGKFGSLYTCTAANLGEADSAALLGELFVLVINLGSWYT